MRCLVPRQSFGWLSARLKRILLVEGSRSGVALAGRALLLRTRLWCAWSWTQALYKPSKILVSRTLIFFKNMFLYFNLFIM